MDSDRVSAITGQRVRQYRLNQDLIQEDLATLANVSLNAVKSAEGGKSTLPTYVAILQALGHIDNLLAAFPDEGVSPVQLLKSSTKQKKRTSGKRHVKPAEDKELDW
ncbi:helix-turn-helix domain-containing protein [Idiomarina piscisalsi]|uniref:Transcriptional regulator n=1 Tax=Idiomarina piscisalsi TaxID=1096243 RepID=A0A432YTX6_9GAMM|nr:helix-turn-helix domain-containing protein [Idiomarina piscisalsi]RUO66770.1 transcriptional regulator [Idiomarina piscisalsi]